MREMAKAVRARSLELRIDAAQRLANRKLLSESEIEAIILDGRGRMTILDGMVKTLAFAAAYPTQRVRDKLLSCTLHGHPENRVHAAALIHFLHGQASSHFDMTFRPFYLQFASKDKRARWSAYLELCARIGVEPQEKA